MSLENLRKIYPGNKSRPFSEIMRTVLTEICRAGDTTTTSFKQNRTVRTFRENQVITQDGIPSQEVIDFWLAEVGEQPYTPQERILAAFKTLTDKQADGLELFFERGSFHEAHVVRALKSRQLIERGAAYLEACEHVAELWPDSERRHQRLAHLQQKPKPKNAPENYGKDRWDELGPLIHSGLSQTQLSTIKRWCDDPQISINVLFGKVRRLTGGTTAGDYAA